MVLIQDAVVITDEVEGSLRDAFAAYTSMAILAP